MHIPLIILSANNSIDMKIEGVASGADVYIAKPFDTNYLKMKKHLFLAFAFLSVAFLTSAYNMRPILMALFGYGKAGRI
jgi:CheY-like chemotaxis protein